MIAVQSLKVLFNICGANIQRPKGIQQANGLFNVR